MKGEATYYRVDLATGVTLERQPYGSYPKGHPEVGVTVFRRLHEAKARFQAISKAEVERLQAMRKALRGVKNRAALAAAHQPSGEAHR